MKNITPEQFRCAIGASCPAVYELDDGSLLIIGKRGDAIPVQATPLPVSVGDDEYAIVIDRAMLANVAR